MNQKLLLEALTKKRDSKERVPNPPPQPPPPTPSYLEVDNCEEVAYAS